MIQCKDCEHCQRSESGELRFSCDPFSNIKEPECLQKWQLLKTNELVAGYHSMLDYYNRFAPMQEKMFKMVEQEIDDMSDAEKWKRPEEQEDDGSEGWDLGDPTY